MHTVLSFRPDSDLSACHVEQHHRTLLLTDGHGSTTVWQRSTVAPAAHRTARLTPAERTVVALVADGLTNKEVAGRLHVSVRTVDSHVSHALLKLGASSRVQLAGIVLRAEMLAG